MGLQTTIKTLQDIMRKDAGVDGDAQRLSQLVWMIFLMTFDSREEEAELDDGYKPVIPEGYRWRDWAKEENVKKRITGPELLDFVNNKLIPYLGGSPIRVGENEKIVFNASGEKARLVREIMSDTSNYMKNGYLLREVINELNKIDFTSAHEVHQFNEMYESLLRGLQSAGTMGEFYTNRAITAFAVERVDPQLGGVLADFACGTGGFLVEALRYMSKQTGSDPNKQAMLQTAVRGGELKPLAYKLAVCNLLLNGVDLPNIRYGDSLNEKGLGEYYGDDLVDYLAMNPPYGGIALDVDKMSFPAELRSSDTADLFVALAVKRLKQNGRAVIVLPDGFLFGTDNAKVAIKKMLMRDCNLHTIIRLPQSCFAPYTSIATNLLFFDKTHNTQETWFYRLDMPEGYKHFSKTKPMKREHFAPVDGWWNNRVEIKDSETDTYKAKKFTYDELEALGFNIDLCGYPVEEKIILSPEDTIKNFKEHRSSLDSEIDRKIAKIERLLGVVNE